MVKDQSEMVDIVDNKNIVIGKTTKTDSHKKGLLHRCTIAEVINNKGEWLLVKQASDRQDAGQYVSPVGGHVKSDESEIVALKREAQEELGIKEEFKYELVGREIFNREILGRKENHLFILYKIYWDKEIVLNHESDSYRWFTVVEIKKELKTNPKIFGDAFHFVVDKFFAYIR